MNILEWYHNRKVKAREKRIEEIRQRAKADLKFIRENKNEGLIRSRLFHMQGVISLNTSSQYGNVSIDITMSDQYTISSYEYGYENAVRSAALQVYDRLQETILK